MGLDGWEIQIVVQRRYSMILPKIRDPRFITIRRGGTLTDSDHHLLAMWAATCAEHVLHLFESAKPSDLRPRQAIEHARAWARGEIRMSQSREAGGHAMAAAREFSGAARYAAYAAGQRQERRMLPRTSSAPQPTRSRPPARLRPKVRARAPASSNAVGSAISCRMRFANLFWTISGCETTSAGRYSTADVHV